MHTLKRFIQYYAPYKAVFFLDLVCAAIISLVDLAFPQILRTLTRTVVCRKMRLQLCVSLVPIGIVLLLDLCSFRHVCKYYVSYQGHMMGAQYGTGYAPTTYLTIMKNYRFLITIRTIPDR